MDKDPGTEPWGTPAFGGTGKLGRKAQQLGVPEVAISIRRK